MNGKQALGLPFPEQKQNNDQEWKCESDGALGEHSYARDDSAPKQPGRIVVLITFEKNKEGPCNTGVKKRIRVGKMGRPCPSGHC